MLEIRLLGQFEVWLDGVKLENAWPRRHARDVLQLVALQPQMRLHKEQITEAIWRGEDAEKRLYYVLHALRKTLEPTLSQPSKSRYVSYREGFVELQDVWVDVKAFEEKLSQENPPKDLEEALELYRGDLLSDNLYTPWLDAERERLKQRYVAALGQVFEHYQNDPEKTPRLLGRLIAAEPSEVHYRKLITFYGEQGNLYEATRYYQHCLEFLRDLGTEPEAETEALLETLRQQQQPLPMPVSVSSFPLLGTPMVGRDKELREVAKLLSRGTRLVTLTGPAGVGKTRLALELASALQSQFSHGVVTLSLAALQAPELFMPALRQGLGASGDVGQYLKEKNLLLVLDNCEHLPDAMPYVATLLETAPLVSVLATSRTPLHLRGETCIEIKPLLLQSAVDLFQMRVKAAQPTLEISPEETVAIAKLCQELDALPLAIELAAARRNILSIQAIRQRLNERLDFKNTERNSPERHRSLRTALEWSLSLLPEESKTLFASLGVFAGPFGLEEAADICGVESAALLEALEGLLEHHLLITAQQKDEQRFSMLETVRVYSTELLSEFADAHAVHQRHANYYFEIVEEADKNRASPQLKMWLDKLEWSYSELRKALVWLFEHVPEKACTLVAKLQHFWYIKAYYEEGKFWHRQVLAVALTEEALYNSYQGLAVLMVAQGNRKEGKVYLEKCLELSYAQADPHRQATTLGHLARTMSPLATFDEVEAIYQRLFVILEGETDNLSLRTKSVACHNLGCLAFRHGRLDEAEHYFEEALELNRGLGYEQAIAHSLVALAGVAYMRQNWELAEGFIERCTQLCDHLDYSLLRPTLLIESGLVALAKQSYVAAYAHLQQGFELARQMSDQEVTSEILLALAAWGAKVNKSTWAVQQLSLSKHLRAQLEFDFVERDKQLFAATKQDLQSQLGDRAFKAAWQLGMVQKLEDVLANLPKDTIISYIHLPRTVKSLELLLIKRS